MPTVPLPLSDSRIVETVSPAAAKSSAVVMPSIDAVAAAVAATIQRRGKFVPGGGQNPIGGKVRRPYRGAKGIAGLRADLMDGKVTIRELSMMSSAELRQRYRVSGPTTYRMKRYILTYGLDGAHRMLDGTPRKT